MRQVVALIISRHQLIRYHQFSSQTNFSIIGVHPKSSVRVGLVVFEKQDDAFSENIFRLQLY